MNFRLLFEGSAVCFRFKNAAAYKGWAVPPQGNKSADVRFPNVNASIVMGIGHDARLNLGLPQPLLNELQPFIPITGRKHTAVATKGDLQ